MTLDRDDLLQRFDSQVRSGIVAEPGIRVERTVHAVRVVGAWSCVLFSQLDEESADREISAQIDRFAHLGRQFEWKVYGHDRPDDLGERLEAAGFEPEAEETFMVFDLANGLPSAEPPSGITVRQVDDADGLSDVCAVGERAFGVDYSALNEIFLARVPLGTVTFYVAYDGGEPVSAARLETPPDSEFAGLYGGGTAPAYRRRGIYRSLVGVRAREAQRRGYRYLNVDAAPESLPILERLGFTALTNVRAFLWRPLAAS